MTEILLKRCYRPKLCSHCTFGSNSSFLFLTSCVCGTPVSLQSHQWLQGQGQGHKVASRKCSTQTICTKVTDKSKFCGQTYRERDRDRDWRTDRQTDRYIEIRTDQWTRGGAQLNHSYTPISSHSKQYLVLSHKELSLKQYWPWENKNIVFK